MKKLLNVILASFLVLGMIGCANASGGDSGAGNGNGNGKYPTVEGFKATAGENGVILTLPDAPSGATRLSIGRINTARPEDNHNSELVYWYMMYNGLDKKEFVDPFVEPGATYDYIVYYRYDAEENGLIKAVSNDITVKATNGSGELTIDEGFKVSYNENTSVIKVDKNPFSDEKMKDVSISVTYGKDNDFMEPHFQYPEIMEVNCSEFLTKNNKAILFDKPLERWNFGINKKVDNVRYSIVNVPKSAFPETITVKK